MRRALIAALSTALVLPALAAGPASQSPPEGIDAEMTLSREEASTYDGPSDTGAVNVWTHMSLWDGNTCHSGSPDNRCDKVLLEVAESGVASMTLAATYPGMDYDLVVFESGASGSVYNEVAHEQNEIYVGNEGPIPLPGDESVTFEVEAGRYYLAVVFYRAAGGGYSLTGQVLDAADLED